MDESIQLMDKWAKIGLFSILPTFQGACLATKEKYKKMIG